MARWLSICVWVCLAASLAVAADVKSLEFQGYVNDFAHVIDPATRAELERYCTDLDQSTGAQLAIITVDTLGGVPIEDFANQLYRKWGIGQKQGPNRDQGALLLLAVNDHKSRLEVGFGLEPIMPDGMDGSVLRAMRPSLREGKYGDALQVAAHTIGSTIAQSKGVQIKEGVRHNPPSHPDQGDNNWGGIVVFVVILLIMIWINRRRGGGGRYYGGGGGFFPGFILGNVLGSRGGFGSGSSGGFGGYDSGGGGFGGFGGGDSGGGGASSDW